MPRTLPGGLKAPGKRVESEEIKEPHEGFRPLAHVGHRLGLDRVNPPEERRRESREESVGGPRESARHVGQRAPDDPED